MSRTIILPRDLFSNNYSYSEESGLYLPSEFDKKNRSEARALHLQHHTDGLPLFEQLLKPFQINKSRLPNRVQPYLDHRQKMSLVLKGKAPNGVVVTKYGTRTKDSKQSRFVAIKDKLSKKPVAIAFIKINANELGEEQQDRIFDSNKDDAFGMVLEETGTKTRGEVQSFYRIQDVADKKKLFDFLDPSTQQELKLDNPDVILYGRKNHMYKAFSDEPVAIVYEFIIED
jgi:hypothetical protein